MLKKSLLLFFFFIFSLLIMVGAFFYFNRQRKNIISINNNQSASATETGESVTTPIKPAFYVSGWLPYWQKQAGVDSLSGNLDSFSEINLFAFGVNSDGSLRDTAKIKEDPWPKLKAETKAKNVAIVPTILWADAPAMHQIFSDPLKLDKHIAEIFAMLSQNDFPGVDIDYEGKDITDKYLFIVFLEALRKKLEPSGKKIECTVEARSEDNPPEGLTGTRAMSFANDYSALNKNCDSVRIMAYDQVFQVNGGQKIFDDLSETPTAPNADIHWVEAVMRYAAQYIPSSKLVMGVPTYGWEFSLNKKTSGYHYERVRSVTYPQALEELSQSKAKLERTAGGEPYFIYDASDGKHLVTFSDAKSVGQKIELAKKLGLQGVSFFKLDGQTYPALFDLIKAEKL